MAWLYLIVAGVFEIGWPLGLKLGWNENGIRPWPLTLAIACMAMSGLFLLLAQRTLPDGNRLRDLDGNRSYGHVRDRNCRIL